MVLLLEVIGHALLEVPRFADVDDLALIVSEQVASGIMRKGVERDHALGQTIALPLFYCNQKGV
jgi:hypothetical protein